MSGKERLCFQQSMYRLKLIQRDWYLGCSAPYPINTTRLVPTTGVVLTTAHKYGQYRLTSYVWEAHLVCWSAQFQLPVELLWPLSCTLVHNHAFTVSHKIPYVHCLVATNMWYDTKCTVAVFFTISQTDCCPNVLNLHRKVDICA
jgi:hypothetical protein